jgi:hypothetical protein
MCTFRSEFFPRWLEDAHVTWLRLDRFLREQTGRIVSEVTGGKELPRGMQEQS